MIRNNQAGHKLVLLVKIEAATLLLKCLLLRPANGTAEIHGTVFDHRLLAKRALTGRQAFADVASCCFPSEGRGLPRALLHHRTPFDGLCCKLDNDSRRGARPQVWTCVLNRPTAGLSSTIGSTHSSDKKDGAKAAARNTAYKPLKDNRYVVIAEVQYASLPCYQSCSPLNRIGRGS